MSNFNKFLQKFFEYHPYKKSKTLEKIYKKICENNVLTDLFLNKIQQENIVDEKILLDLYRNKLTKILLYIGLNDIDSINYCIRSSVEYLLKFLFCIQNKLDIYSANNTSYRYLSESLKDVSKELYVNMKEDIIPLLGIYGNFSNKLHGKNINKNNEIQYLEDILTTKSIDYVKLLNSIIIIIDTYETILVKMLKLNIKNLSSNEVFKITDFWDKDKINRLLKTS
ncbi:hypothetical protein [Clostridium massiliodielmoense]|uniref:hypothetical protein n=1 Tax=Clostridium massiliodielmoense TaxID=1776385 RepID=UPI000A269A7B|nr:hypothetical protein [Clostridium massiliodielmoense]